MLRRVGLSNAPHLNVKSLTTSPSLTCSAHAPVCSVLINCSFQHMIVDSQLRSSTELSGHACNGAQRGNVPSAVQKRAFLRPVSPSQCTLQSHCRNVVLLQALLSIVMTKELHNACSQAIRVYVGIPCRAMALHKFTGFL